MRLIGSVARFILNLASVKKLQLRATYHKKKSALHIYSLVLIQSRSNLIAVLTCLHFWQKIFWTVFHFTMSPVWQVLIQRCLSCACYAADLFIFFYHFLAVTVMKWKPITNWQPVLPKDKHNCIWRWLDAANRTKRLEIILKGISRFLQILEHQSMQAFCL